MRALKKDVLSVSGSVYSVEICFTNIFLHFCRPRWAISFSFSRRSVTGWSEQLYWSRRTLLHLQTAAPPPSNAFMSPYAAAWWIPGMNSCCNAEFKMEIRTWPPNFQIPSFRGRGGDFVALPCYPCRLETLSVLLNCWPYSFMPYPLSGSKLATWLFVLDKGRDLCPWKMFNAEDSQGNILGNSRRMDSWARLSSCLFYGHVEIS